MPNQHFPHSQVSTLFAPTLFHYIRAVSETKINAASSRGHAIFSLSVVEDDADSAAAAAAFTTAATTASTAAAGASVSSTPVNSDSEAEPEVEERPLPNLTEQVAGTLIV